MEESRQVEGHEMLYFSVNLANVKLCCAVSLKQPDKNSKKQSFFHLQGLFLATRESCSFRVILSTSQHDRRMGAFAAWRTEIRIPWSILARMPR